MHEAVVLIPVFAAVLAAGVHQWWTGVLVTEREEVTEANK